jgi:cell division protein FtsZ
MALKFNVDESFERIIKVMGVGGGGSNAVSNMYVHGIKGISFSVCNTDGQALARSPVPEKIQIGTHTTEGLGCGADPEMGKRAAEESIETLRKVLSQNIKMLFLTAGMGGGTGTGASPIIAKLAKELGILTIGIVTRPFTFEGNRRRRVAEEGINELRKFVDSLLIINNDNILKIAPKNMKQKEAFKMADQILLNAAKGIAEIITVPGYVNVDFADVRTIMRNSGTAIMGVGVAEGKDRAKKAIEMAMNSPLLDNTDIRGAKGILLNIAASEDTYEIHETEIITNYLQDHVDPEAQIIFGCVFDNSLKDQLSVTLIATGIGQQNLPPAPNTQKAKQLSLEGLYPPKNQKETTNVNPTQDSTPQLENHSQTQTHTAIPPTTKLNPEERLKKLRKQAMDIENPQYLLQMNQIPAYKRRQMDLPLGMRPKQTTPPPSLGKLKLTLDDENNVTISPNTFLYDNAD